MELCLRNNDRTVINISSKCFFELGQSTAFHLVLRIVFCVQVFLYCPGQQFDSVLQTWKEISIEIVEPLLQRNNMTVRLSAKYIVGNYNYIMCGK